LPDAIRQDLERRNVDQVEVGPELGLARARIVQLASTIDATEAAHLAGLDAKREVHHIVVDADGVSRAEVIGSLAAEAKVDMAALDIVEYPRGTIRIAAGDHEYSRSIVGGEWSRTGGNRCRQYLMHGASLYCAFVASGEEVGTAPRRDWSGLRIVILPLIWPKIVRPGKLVLAERVESSWIVRAVLDSADDWSADETDFAIGRDEQGLVHAVFCVWRGGTIVGGTPAPIVGEVHTTSGPDRGVRYARVRLADDRTRSGARTDWQEVQSEPIESHIRSRDGRMLQLRFRIAIMPKTGVALELADRNSGYATTVVNTNNFDQIAVEGVPKRTYYWGEHYPILRIGGDVIRHVLVSRCPFGFHSSPEACHRQMVYVRCAENGRLAITIFEGAEAPPPAVRTLAVGSGSSVFVAWVAKPDRLVGHWIQSRPSPPESAPQ
jgi:hypothetical protein